MFKWINRQKKNRKSIINKTLVNSKNCVKNFLIKSTENNRHCVIQQYSLNTVRLRDEWLYLWIKKEKNVNPKLFIMDLAADGKNER